MPQPADLVHGWVSTHCGRGTIDIIWSCLFTIFICVWTTIHLPVPHYTGQWPLGLRAKIVRSKLVPALIAFVAPEVLTIIAVLESLQAVETVKKFRYLTGNEISLTTGFFYNMGGFCLKTPSGDWFQSTPTSLEHFVTSSNPGGERWPQPVHQLWMDEIAKVSEYQLNDSAGSDTLTKGIACAQVTWFVTQVVSRLCQHDSVTLLEVSTTAYVLCAVTSYTAWWKKPQGCTLPIFIPCEEGALPLTAACIKGTWKEFVWGGKNWWTIKYGSSYIDFSLGVTMILTPLVFGAVHLTSWNVSLPSAPELWLWRASTLYCSLVTLILSLGSAIIPFLVASVTFESAGRFSYTVLLPIYCIIRVYMIIEICISLRALPRSAYNSVQWSAFVPHV